MKSLIKTPLFTKKPSGAVSVPLVWQRIIFYGLLASMVVSVISVVWMYGFNNASYSPSIAWTMAFYQLIPVAAFGTAYYLSPKQPIRINRLFIAAVKAVGIMGIAGALQTLKNYGGFIFLYTPNGSNYLSGQPPEWVTSIVGDYLIYGVCFVVFIYVCYRTRKVL